MESDANDNEGKARDDVVETGWLLCGKSSDSAVPPQASGGVGEKDNSLFEDATGVAANSET